MMSRRCHQVSSFSVVHALSSISHVAAVRLARDFGVETQFTKKGVNKKSHMLRTGVRGV